MVRAREHRGRGRARLARASLLLLEIGAVAAIGIAPGVASAGGRADGGGPEVGGSTTSAYAASSARAPFLVAAVTFAMQSLLTGAVLPVTSRLKTLAACSAAARRLKLIEEAILVYNVISMTSFCAYALFAFGSTQTWLVVHPVGMSGPHIGLRNAVWLVTTPLQWYIFCKTCTNASLHDVASIMAHTVIMQVTGLCCLVTGSSTLFVAMFAASSLSFAAMFWKAFTVPPLIDDLARIVRPVLYCELALWAAYPVVFGARAAGLIGVWTEQVLVYTVLDVGAKTVTLTTILMTGVYVILQRVQGLLPEQQVGLSL